MWLFFVCLFSEVLGFWGFTITPLIYSEFIFVYDTKYWSRFAFCFKNQSPDHLGKVKLFSIESPLCLCQKSIDHVCVCLFLEGLLLPLLIFALRLLPFPHSPHARSSLTGIPITYLCLPPHLVFFLKTDVAPLLPLASCTHSRISFVNHYETGAFI